MWGLGRGGGVRRLLEFRAGHLRFNQSWAFGFADLQSGLKSYFQAILTRPKKFYLWARPIKIAYLKSNAPNGKFQK